MIQTKRERLEALTDERNEAVARLESLKHDRAQARINGEAFDGDAEIGTLQSTIDGLSEAVDLMQDQLNREEDRKLAGWKADRAKRLGLSIADHAVNYVASVERAAVAMDALVSELSNINACAMSIAAAGREIDGVNDVPAMAVQTIMMRMSERLGRAFSRIQGITAVGNYGRFSWVPEQGRAENWGVEESREVEAAIEGLLQRLEQEIEKQRALASAE
jgi:hypothetical protein